MQYTHATHAALFMFCYALLTAVSMHAYTQACRLHINHHHHDALEPCELEVARISSINCSGMVFQPDSWIISIDDNQQQEIIYVDAMFQTNHNSCSGCLTAHYLQAYRFSFEELKAITESNRIRISAEHFQKLLDAAPAAHTHGTLDGTFSPSRCSLRGRWAWTPEVYQQWAQRGLVRSIHLANVSADELIFIFR